MEVIRVPEFKTKRIRCKDCGETFEFGTGEQAYFWSKGMSEPKRCHECRAKRKATLTRDSREVNHENG